MNAEASITPSHWAGGVHVCVPGLGVGRIISESPRVIEIALPAPECAIVQVGDRVVVLADPRVPHERTLRAIAAARHLEGGEAGDEPDALPVAVGDSTPPAGLPVVATHPGLRLVRAGAGTGG